MACKNINYHSPARSILIKQRLKITANLLLSLSPDRAWSATRHWDLGPAVVQLLDSEISACKHFLLVSNEISISLTSRPRRSYGFLCPVWSLERLAPER